MSHFLAHRHEPLCHPALEIWAQPRLADARLRSHSWSHRTRDSEKVSSPRAIYQNFLNRLMTSRPAERISSQHERSPRRNLGASHHMPAHDSTIAVGPHPTGLLPALTTETLQEDSHKPACDRRSSEASRREDKHEGVTLVVRNIPRTMTVAQLQDRLAETGFCGLYDFLYLPFAFTTKNTRRAVNKSYAFINLIDEKVAQDFRMCWSKIKLWDFQTGLPSSVNITMAVTQGRSKNMQKWSCTKTSRIRNANYRPQVIQVDTTLGR
eukprot:gnl/TRDRNA2_/TRDRNA2_88403_c0_seq1.p1 gnl/TRDRNA2_/TRDRNA2_88403_c0~~gnl/TRDRNA2_/TRDRNA2_88403_c0_seq1.p1  ORF type:complete len:278 (-),score=14.06 gnl/TRDRNA2_/TRDRNA2_88403_c0_seq1:7-804(-)